MPPPNRISRGLPIGDRTASVAPVADDLVRAIEAVEQIAGSARPVPLTNDVRIERRRLEAAVADVRSAATSSGIVADAEFERGLEDLEKVASRTKPVPLTDQVRFNGKKLDKALGRLRSRLSSYGWT